MFVSPQATRPSSVRLGGWVGGWVGVILQQLIPSQKTRSADPNLVVEKCVGRLFLSQATCTEGAWKSPKKATIPGYVLGPGIPEPGNVEHQNSHTWIHARKSYISLESAES